MPLFWLILGFVGFILFWCFWIALVASRGSEVRYLADEEREEVPFRWKDNPF